MKATATLSKKQARQIVLIGEARCDLRRQHGLLDGWMTVAQKAPRCVRHRMDRGRGVDRDPTSASVISSNRRSRPFPAVAALWIGMAGPPAPAIAASKAGTRDAVSATLSPP
jgi:hypothetical protein